MTDFTTRNLHQKCCYWGNPIPDGYGGFTFDEPVELDCRWEDISMTELAALGIASTIRSEVYLSQDVDEQGMLLLKELVELDSSEYNDPVSAGAFIIVRFDRIPTLKANKFLRKAYVGRLWTGKN